MARYAFSQFLSQESSYTNTEQKSQLWLERHAT